MNELIVGNLNQTMSSLEIAKLTGKEHAHVMRDIRNMLLELRGDTAGLSSFGSSYLNSQNKEQPCFQLPKDETLCLMSGYDVKARMVIIKRWQELEATQQFQLPQTFSAALKLAGELQEQVESQSILLEEQKPMVAALNRISKSVHENNLRDAAKVLQIKPGTMSGWLASLRWISKGNGKHWFPLQPAIDSGYMVTRENEQELEDGSVKIRPQAMVTQKGVEKLALMLSTYPMCNVI